MQIKIRGTVYDSRDEPIMLILSQEEKDQISHMTIEDVKFCAYPDDNKWVKNNYELIKKWINNSKKENEECI